MSIIGCSRARALARCRAIARRRAKPRGGLDVEYPSKGIC
jgi:hypothetical protein